MTQIQSEELSPEAYGILDECKCGPEPFFVLVSSVDLNDMTALKAFEKTLSDLIDASLLRAFRGSRSVAYLALDDIITYVAARLSAGEDLDEPPIAYEELSFETTDEGLALLKEEDRPTKTT